MSADGLEGASTLFAGKVGDSVDTASCSVRCEQGDDDDGGQTDGRPFMTIDSADISTGIDGIGCDQRGERSRTVTDADGETLQAQESEIGPLASRL